MFADETTMCTSMVELHSFAFQRQEIEVGIILMLRHAENLPPFQVKHKLSLSFILLMWKNPQQKQKKPPEKLLEQSDAAKWISNWT